MSKQTKMIAIIGGVLILCGVIYIGAFGTGFKGAMRVVGCGKADPGKPRPQLNVEDQRINDCRGYGYVLKRDDKTGELKKEGGMEVKDQAKDCNKLVAARCKDAAFRKNYKMWCEQASKKDETKDEE
jgi:hypothetical protein